MKRLLPTDYEGYRVVIEYSIEEDVYHGHVVNSADFISFEGRTFDEVLINFHEAVDDYLLYCKENSINPSTKIF